MIPVKFRNTVLFRYPKIPKIQQTAIDDFDRNAFDEAIARVDRCQSCHMGADKKGFENAPEPFRTHSNFDQIILKHPPDKLGCTPCHDGQGPAVSSVRLAHGDDPDWDSPMLRGDKMQSRCIKCHIDVGSLHNADGKPIATNWVEGERDVPADGMRGMPSGRGLRGHAEDRAVPETGVGQARSVVDRAMDHRSAHLPAAYPHAQLLFHAPTRRRSSPRSSSTARRRIRRTGRRRIRSCRRSRRDIKNPAFVEEGKGLFESVGCKGCHAIEPDQYGTPVGVAEGFKPNEARTTKDFAPNLGKIAEKTSASWIYTWLKNPRDFSPHTAMPSLRLSDHEAEALTAFLMTHGEKKEDAGVDTALKDPENIKKGEALVRKYGCFGCHEIEGMDKESRIGVELTTFGSKHLDELFFGNQTDIPETWDRLDVPQAPDPAHLPDQGRRAVDAEFRLRRRRHQQPAACSSPA